MQDPGTLRKQLDLLLTAYGYNLYNDANRSRADDLLVRERASALVGEAAAWLKVIAADYSHRFVPPATREQPFPPADRMAAVQEFGRLQDALGMLSSQIRGMPVPAGDKTWARFRKEEGTLHQLLHFDYTLVRQAEDIVRFVEPLDAGDWSDPHGAELRSLIHSLEQTARERQRLLTAM